MPRFDFTSPGAAFTGEITRVLTQRKAEDRQRLLDGLQFSADQRAEAENNRQEEEAKLRNQALQQRMLLDKLGVATSYLEEGDDPASRNLDPELVKAGQGLGVFQSRPTPQATATISSMTDTEGNPAEGFTPEQAAPTTPQTHLAFSGSAEQREKARKRQAGGDLISQLFATKDPVKIEAGTRLANLMAANDGVITQEMIDSVIPMDVPTGIFDEGTGKFKDGPKLSGRTRIFNQPQKPSGYYNERMPVWAGNDMGSGEAKYFVPGQSTPQGFGLTRGADRSESPLGIPQTALDRHNENMAMLNFDPKTGVAEAGPMLAWRQSAANIVGAARATSNVKNIAMLYIQNPDAAQQLAASTQLTQDERTDLAQIISNIGNGQITEVIRRNPPPEFGKPERKY